MFKSIYNEFTDNTVLNRLALLDEILDSNKFLVGLSDQAEPSDNVLQFNVVNDLVLGFHLYCHSKKPRIHKGEFSSFDCELAWISNTANYISGDSRTYLNADDTMYKVQEQKNLQEVLRTRIRERADELKLAQSWADRPEFRLPRNDMSTDDMLEMLEVIVEHYFKILTKFAFVADFEKVSLCTVFIEQLHCGGMPCGWLSKKPYWDLSEWQSNPKPRGARPQLHEGVFSDPREHLAMLYLN